MYIYIQSHAHTRYSHVCVCARMREYMRVSLCHSLSLSSSFFLSLSLCVYMYIYSKLGEWKSTKKHTCLLAHAHLHTSAHICEQHRLTYISKWLVLQICTQKCISHQYLIFPKTDTERDYLFVCEDFLGKRLSLFWEIVSLILGFEKLTSRDTRTSNLMMVSTREDSAGPGSVTGSAVSATPTTPPPE